MPEESVIVGRLLEAYNIPKADVAAFNYGYDAQTGQCVDMIKAGSHKETDWSRG